MVQLLRIPKYSPIFSSVRFYVHDSVVRVRFAPSPTGYLHLGGLRTALYNYFFAKANNGKLILRIEDTDQCRLVPGAIEKLIGDLEWSGIQIDEGPKRDYKHHPYYQSNRLKLYKKEVNMLLESGKAYYCFCTENRLKLLRNEAIRNGQIPKYDNKCRHLSLAQAIEKLNKLKYCVRFKLSNCNISIDDMIYGEIAYNVAEHEGDPIIMKSDGFPTYHLANVVDDHHMKITHVLRGVEWQISTTKHLLLYRAFGWQPPQFGHLPLLVNSDGTKLSKRQGDIHISYYRDQGIFPLAILNYIIRTGGGFRTNLVKNKLYSIDELVQLFDISRINVSPSKLNPDLLWEFNRMELHEQLLDKNKCSKLVQDAIQFIKRKYPNEEHLDLDPNHVKQILKWASPRISSIHELTTENLSFLWVLPSDKIEAEFTKATFSDLMCSLAASKFSKNDLNQFLKRFSEEKDVKFPKLMKTLRAALSGLKEGPGVAEMMEVLGKDATMQRLRNINCK